jgi:hypothetical protein
VAAFATAGVGGGIAVGSLDLFGFPDASSITVSGSTLSVNLAQGGDGGRGGNGGDAWGGSLAALGGTATISNSTLDYNAAIGGDGQDGGNAFGGGIYVAGGTTVGVTHSTITRNRADGGASDDAGSDGLGEGGGVYRLGIFTFDGTTLIAHNHASTKGDDMFR